RQLVEAKRREEAHDAIGDEPSGAGKAMMLPDVGIGGCVEAAGDLVDQASSIEAVEVIGRDAPLGEIPRAEAPPLAEELDDRSHLGSVRGHCNNSSVDAGDYLGIIAPIARQLKENPAMQDPPVILGVQPSRLPSQRAASH